MWERRLKSSWIWKSKTWKKSSTIEIYLRRTLKEVSSAQLRCLLPLIIWSSSLWRMRFKQWWRLKNQLARMFLGRVIMCEALPESMKSWFRSLRAMSEAISVSSTKWRSTWTILRIRLSCSKLRWVIGRKRNPRCSVSSRLPRINWSWSKITRTGRLKIWIANWTRLSKSWKSSLLKLKRSSKSWRWKETASTKGLISSTLILASIRALIIAAASQQSLSRRMRSTTNHSSVGLKHQRTSTRIMVTIHRVNISQLSTPVPTKPCMSSRLIAFKRCQTPAWSWALLKLYTAKESRLLQTGRVSSKRCLPLLWITIWLAARCASRKICTSKWRGLPLKCSKLKPCLILGGKTKGSSRIHTTRTIVALRSRLPTPVRERLKKALHLTTWASMAGVKVEATSKLLTRSRACIWISSAQP